MSDTIETTDDRKRSARMPGGPAHARQGSLLQTAKRTFTEFSEDNLTDAAAALTYYAVLSIFPALLAMISIVGLVADPKTVTDALTKIVGSIGPASAVDALKGPIAGLTQSSGTAGIMVIVGIVGALWTASGYVGAFMRASNVIYEVKEGRPFWKLRPLQVALTLLVVMLITAVAIAIVVTGPIARAVGDQVGLGNQAVTLFNITKWPLIVLVLLTIVGLLYYVAPNVRQRGFPWITPGGVLSLVVWAAASAGLAFYAAKFGSYQKTYGSLAGAILFLVWLWVSNMALLLGLELNAELERGRELAAGLPADRELQLPPRAAASS
jgi:membrane protein